MSRKKLQKTAISVLQLILSFSYPGTIFFVIFWFPIVIPLLINLIASTTELAIQASSIGETNKSVIWNIDFLLLLFKNSHLAFLSTDLWALSTTLMYAAKGNLMGMRAWVYGCAGIIALFLHLFFYAVTILVTNFESDAWIACILFLAGCISVLWLRLVIFQAIERRFDLPELRAMTESN